MTSELGAHYSDRNVLVTGGAGAIGSELADALLARGDEVVVLDNFSSGKRERVAAGCRLIGADLLDGDSISGMFGGAFEGIEIVYHLAADPDRKPPHFA